MFNEMPLFPPLPSPWDLAFLKEGSVVLSEAFVRNSKYEAAALWGSQLFPSASQWGMGVSVSRASWVG